ncbi:MAG: sugar phosphate isomerase/epimerase [Bacteroidales bacterium]|jgi:sugar phosphate isomerase/epimerase|nr:sugar phosphate isomerase/epimerase [Bacteroidales bacterium]
MERKESLKTISRRSFIGKVMLSAAAGAIISSCKKTDYQIACYTRPWFDHDYRVALDGIAEAGYKYAGIMTDKGGRIITLDTTVEQAVAVGNEVSKRGLKVASLSAGSFNVSNSVNEGIEELKRWIDNTAGLGAPVVHLGGVTDPALADAYFEAIAECCDYAAGKGVRLSLKTHGGLNSTGAGCRKFIEKVNHKNFGLWYDPGNVYYYSDGLTDPVDDAEYIDNIVFGMSVKDFKMPKDVSVTPGTGMVDFPKLLKRLNEGGFRRGPLVVEGLYQGDVDFINAEARKAREYLEQLISEL